MSGRNRRTHYDFSLGAGVSIPKTEELPRLIAAHIHCAQLDLLRGDRDQALARMAAALELTDRLRIEGEQTRLL